MRNPKVSRITSDQVSVPSEDYYTVIWVQEDIELLEVDSIVLNDIAQCLVFVEPNQKWVLQTNSPEVSKGYILKIPNELMKDAQLKNRLINEFRLFAQESIPIIKPAPGIAFRIQAILEMIEELLTTELDHREDAIVSLLNTFFVYCDGQCNIQLSFDKTNRKAQLVHKYKELVKDNFKKYHDVSSYAELLNISAVYLNECVQTVLGYNAKSVIVEAQIMTARQALKFSNESIKEISFDLGFSSADYFSTFFKNHTGFTPSDYRKS